MGGFDPAHDRHILTGDCGYEFDLAADFEQAKAVGGRGSSADAFLGTAIRCILHGLAKPASQLLKKAEHWVSVANAEREIPSNYLQYIRDEPYIVDGGAAHRCKTLALCNWLLHDQHDAESFRQFVELEDRFLASSRAGRDKANVSLTLPTYVDAGAYQRALQLFVSTRGMSAPKSLGSIRNEGQMSYVLCRHRLHHEFAEDEVQAAVGWFLDKNVDGWLRNGHFVRAAEWMKIVYWQESKARISARDAVLRCYEHLPGCR
jgi:hypothetical protein